MLSEVLVLSCLCYSVTTFFQAFCEKVMKTSFITKQPNSSLTLSSQSQLNCMLTKDCTSAQLKLSKCLIDSLNYQNVIIGIFSNYWMRLSRIWRILQIKECVIHGGRRRRWITPSEICRILHILRKPNSIIALLFIQNISSFLKEFRHYALCISAHQI